MLLWYNPTKGWWWYIIVEFSQTASNIKQLYDISFEKEYFQGKIGSFSRIQSITLWNKDTIVKGIYHLSKWLHYIPLRYLFGKANLTRVFQLHRNDIIYGSVAFSQHGVYKSFYDITLNSGEIFYCYPCAKGSFDYVSIYLRDKQIALIKTNLSTNDYKYRHKLYLIEEFRVFADTLSFFVWYYANYTFSKRFHMSKNSVSTKAWSFSKYNNKYDPRWRETNGFN